MTLRELIYCSELSGHVTVLTPPVSDLYNFILPQAKFSARAGPAALQPPSSPALSSYRSQIPQWGTSKTWAVQLLMPAQSPLLHTADCLEWAPGEQKIKSKPEKDSFLKKKEGKSAKPCGRSLCPAAAESWTFGKRQEELNCFTPELLTVRQSTTHTHLPSTACYFCLGYEKILAPDSRNIYQEKISC